MHSLAIYLAGKVLGSGAFGKVMNATAYGISKTGVSIQVAVKMLKGTVEYNDMQALTSHLSPLFPVISVATACLCFKAAKGGDLGLVSAKS